MNNHFLKNCHIENVQKICVNFKCGDFTCGAFSSLGIRHYRELHYSIILEIKWWFATFKIATFKFDQTKFGKGQILLWQFLKSDQFDNLNDKMTDANAEFNNLSNKTTDAEFNNLSDKSP